MWKANKTTANKKTNKDIILCCFTRGHISNQKDLTCRHPLLPQRLPKLPNTMPSPPHHILVHNFHRSSLIYWSLFGYEESQRPCWYSETPCYARGHTGTGTQEAMLVPRTPRGHRPKLAVDTMY